MAWDVRLDPRAAREFKKLDPPAQGRIVAFLRTRVQGADDPRSVGKAMKGEKVRLWRYRVGDYRIICHIDDKARAVLILRISHRKEAYR